MDRKLELEKQIKAIDYLREKVKRLAKGEKVNYTMDEYDVLLDLRNEISKLPDD